MSDQRLSHPYREPMAIVERLEKRRLISFDVLAGTLNEIDALTAALDRVLRLMPRDDLIELVGRLRHRRRSLESVRQLVSIARGAGMAVSSVATLGAVVAALLKQPHAWYLAPIFLVFLFGAYLVARYTLRVDQLIEAYDKQIARIERTIDSARHDDPITRLEEKTQKYSDESERLNADLKAQIEVESRRSDTNRKTLEDLEGKFRSIQAELQGVRVDARPAGSREDNVVELEEHRDAHTKKDRR